MWSSAEHSEDYDIYLDRCTLPNDIPFTEMSKRVKGQFSRGHFISRVTSSENLQESRRCRPGGESILTYRVVCSSLVAQSRGAMMTGHVALENRRTSSFDCLCRCL